MGRHSLKTLFTALHLLLATAWVHIQEDEFAAFLSTILVAFHISLIMKMREYVTNYLPMVHPTPPHTTAPHHHDCVTLGQYVFFQHSNILTLLYNRPI